jgi:hypothetical protein
VFVRAIEEPKKISVLVASKLDVVALVKFWRAVHQSELARFLASWVEFRAGAINHKDFAQT